MSIRLLNRFYSVSTRNIISDDFVQKYDQFTALSSAEKLQRLTDRGLNVLLASSAFSDASTEVKWGILTSQLSKKNVTLSPYYSHDEAANLQELLRHINIPIFGDPTKNLSLAASDWRHSKQFTIPLSGQAPPDHQLVNKLLLPFLKGRVSLIGAATWNSDETFRTLRFLAERKSYDFTIPYVANIEINPLNARLAHLTACELGLDIHRFNSIEGNVLEGLPMTSTIFKANRQFIIACRLLPQLSFNEISKLLTHIYQHLTYTRGYAVLTYPVLSIKELSQPTSAFFQKYLALSEEGFFGKEELKDLEDDVMGVSFYSRVERPEIGLKKDSLYQTILFEEKMPRLFTDLHHLKICKSESLIGDDSIPRAATVVSRLKD